MKKLGISNKKYKELQEYFDNNSYEVEIVNDQNNCVNQAVAESEEKLKEGDYSRANTILTTADSIVPNNKDISEQLNRVKEYTPVRLTDLTPFVKKMMVILSYWMTGQLRIQTIWVMEEIQV